MLEVVKLDPNVEHPHSQIQNVGVHFIYKGLLYNLVLFVVEAWGQLVNKFIIGYLLFLVENIFNDDSDALLGLLWKNGLNYLRHVLDSQWFLKNDLFSIILRCMLIYFMDDFVGFVLQEMLETLSDRKYFD